MPLNLISQKVKFIVVCKILLSNKYVFDICHGFGDILYLFCYRECNKVDEKLIVMRFYFKQYEIMVLTKF